MSLNAQSYLFALVTGLASALAYQATTPLLRIAIGPTIVWLAPALFCLGFAFGLGPAARWKAAHSKKLTSSLAAFQGIAGIGAAIVISLFEVAMHYEVPGLLWVILPVLGTASGGAFSLLLYCNPQLHLRKVIAAFAAGVGLAIVLQPAFTEAGVRSALTMAASLHLVLTLWAQYKWDSSASYSAPRTAFRTDQGKLFVIAALVGAAFPILYWSIHRYVLLSVGPSPWSELMLGGVVAFSFALGSYTWRSDRQPLSRCGLYLLATLLLFLILYLTLAFWPYWHYLARSTFNDVKTDFVRYELALLGGITLLFALPFAVMGRLPSLLLHFFRDEQNWHPVRAGQLLSALLVGSGLAYLFLGYTLPGAYGNDSLFKGGMFALAVAQGIALSLNFRGRELKMALASCLLLFVSVDLSPRLSPYHFLKPFDLRMPLPEAGREAFSKTFRQQFEYEYFKDGSYSSVGIANNIDGEQIFGRTLFVNGQMVGDTQQQSFAELMLAHLPHLLAARQRKTALFGVGTGHALNAIASYHAVSKIDVVEPSPELWRQRDLLGTSEDITAPRLRWHQTEPIPYLLQSWELHDTIVVNPRLPLWPGSEALLTEEFFKLAYKKLSADGLLVEWVPNALVTPDFLSRALHAAYLAFPEVRVFGLQHGGVALLASKAPIDEVRFILAQQRMESTPVKNSLLQLDIGFLETILADEILTPSDALTVAKMAARPWRWERPLDPYYWERARFQRGHIDVFNLRREVAGEKSNRDNLLRTKLKGNRLKTEAYKELKRVYCLNSQSSFPNLCQETYVLGSILSPGEQWSEAFSRMYPPAAMKPFTDLLKPPAKFTRASKDTLDESLRVLRQFNGPLMQFPREEVLAWFEVCKRTVPKKDPLYGECLFHRLLFEDERGLPKSYLSPLAKEYLEWFKTLPLNTPNYSTFVSVKSMLHQWTE